MSPDVYILKEGCASGPYGMHMMTADLRSDVTHLRSADSLQPDAAAAELSTAVCRPRPPVPVPVPPAFADSAR